jgi:hypothetical protein
MAGWILPGDLALGRAMVEPASATKPGITAITNDMITVRLHAVRQRPSAWAGAGAAGMPAVTDQTRSAPESFRSVQEPVNALRPRPFGGSESG